MNKIDVFDYELQKKIAEYDIEKENVYFTDQVFDIFADKNPSEEELRKLADEIQINLEESEVVDLAFLEDKKLDNFSYLNYNNWDFKKL